MKLVLATSMFPPEIDPRAAYAKTLSEKLSAAHSVTVVAYASTSEPLSTITLRTISKKHALPLRLLKFSWVLFTTTKGCNVILAPNTLASSLPATMIGRIRRIPVLTLFSADEVWERALHSGVTSEPFELVENRTLPLSLRLMRRLHRWTLSHASRVVVETAYLGTLIEKQYGVLSSRIAVIPTPLEREEILHFPPEHHPRRLLTTSRLYAWKGVAGIVRAVARLTSRYPDIELFVAGEGPEKEALVALTRTLSLTQQVKFLGHISRAETVHLRHTSGAYILNTAYEHQPTSLLKSLRARLPVITTRIPGTADSIEDGRTGLLVSPTDDRELSVAITRLFDDAALREYLRDEGYRSLTRVSWESHVDHLISLANTL